MPVEDRITLEGRIVEQLQERLFRAELANGHRVLVHPTRATRALAVKVRAGSWVRLEMSPFDMSTARMVAVLERAESESGLEAPPAQR